MSAQVKQLNLFDLQESVSKAALVAFRVLCNLAARTGEGSVNRFPTLAAMLDVSERRAWQLIAELKAAGWIAWRTIRRKGERRVAWSPLVRLPRRTRGLFAPRSGAVDQSGLPVVGRPRKRSSEEAVGRSSAATEAAFLAPEIAPSSALSTGKNCTLDAPLPYMKTPVGKKDDNTLAQKTQLQEQAQKADVAVSLLENLVSKNEARELAREATRQGLTAEQIHRVIAAYRAQGEKIRNRGAWLREAIRRQFAPPAPAGEATDRPADPSLRPASDFRVKAAPLPGWAQGAKSDKPERYQLGEGYRAAMANRPWMKRGGNS